MTGLRSHVLATEDLSIMVVPELGGRIVELTDLSKGRQWLWRNHHMPLGPVPPGAAYDDVWQGGFEELFPNDAPTNLDGLALPDHGELWTNPWAVAETDQRSITLSTTGPVTGVAVTKTFELDGPDLTLSYRLEHGGESTLHHLFKLHSALAIDDTCRLALPGGMVEKVSDDFGNLLDSTVAEPWPTRADLSQCRSDTSNTNEFVYVSDLPQGRCGVVDTSTASQIHIDYPLEVFPYCWIFMTYGGWRDHNVVVLEPCTNYPKDLQEAIRRGSSASLAPGESIEFEVRVSVGEPGE